MSMAARLEHIAGNAARVAVCLFLNTQELGVYA